jgi:hypothetical protein
MSIVAAQHHQMFSPPLVRQAVSALHGYINLQFGNGQISGQEAEQLTKDVDRLTHYISWPHCTCPDCESSRGKD